MTPDPRAQDEVVLRDTVFVPGAVRLPRSAHGPADAAGSPGASADDPLARIEAAAHADGLRLGREEGRRGGWDEGQRTGYDEGLRRGAAVADEQLRVAVEAAVAAARAPLEAKAARLDALLRGIGDAAQEAWSGAEEDVLALCFETLCRVLGDAVSTPQALRPQVELLLAGSEGKGAITLHLHPSDAMLLDEAARDGWLPQAAGQPVRWRPDPRVLLAGCVVAGTGGGIDARLETILAQCKAGLLQARAARAAERAGLEATP